MNVPIHIRPPSESDPAIETIRLDFIAALAQGRAANCAALRPIVHRAIEFGVSRKRLQRWAVGAGYSRGYVSSLLSQFFTRRPGGRLRAPGAGRKLSPQAAALLRLARRHYGPKARNYLRAAFRAAGAEDRSAPAGPPIPGGYSGPTIRPEPPAPAPYSGPTISPPCNHVTV